MTGVIEEGGILQELNIVVSQQGKRDLEGDRVGPVVKGGIGFETVTEILNLEHLN